MSTIPQECIENECWCLRKYIDKSSNTSEIKYACAGDPSLSPGEVTYLDDYTGTACQWQRYNDDNASTDDSSVITITPSAKKGVRPDKIIFTVENSSEDKTITAIKWKFGEDTGSVQYVDDQSDMSYYHIFLVSGEFTVSALVTFDNNTYELVTLKDKITITEPDEVSEPVITEVKTDTKYIYRVVEVVICTLPTDGESDSTYYLFRYPSITVYSARPTGGQFTYTYSDDMITNQGIYDGHDIMFDVTCNTNGNANSAEVRVYNIPKEIRHKISDRNLPIQISAGYKDNFEVIFDGSTDVVYTTVEGLDTVTTIRCTDSISNLYTDVHNKMNDHEYPPGTDYSVIIRDAVDELGGSVKIDDIEESGYVTSKWETYVGKPYQIIEEVTRKLNGFLIADNNKKMMDDPRYSDIERYGMMMVPTEPDKFIWFNRKDTGFKFCKKSSLSKSGEETTDTESTTSTNVFIFNVNTGLISYEPDNCVEMAAGYSWTAKVLLTPSINVGDKVYIQSIVYGETDKDSKAITPVSLRATTVHHTGSTFGQEYYTTIKGEMDQLSTSGETLTGYGEVDTTVSKGYTRLDNYTKSNIVGG